MLEQHTGPPESVCERAFVREQTTFSVFVLWNTMQQTTERSMRNGMGSSPGNNNKILPEEGNEQKKNNLILLIKYYLYSSNYSVVVVVAAADFFFSAYFIWFERTDQY